jgi:3-polyprenyl-4-hydroxybenzoate decarboxylase
VIALSDIDPENADAILWAMSYRANPSLDFHIAHRDQATGRAASATAGRTPRC